MGESVGPCAVAPGIGKDVKVTHVQFLQEFIGFPELLFSFAGEADDDIHTDIEVRDTMDQGLDEVGEEVPIVVAVHVPEYIVITALQRDVKVVA